MYGAVGASGFNIINSTISGNTAQSGGALAFKSSSGFTGSVVIKNSTITNNSATSTSITAGLGGGGIVRSNGTGTFTLSSTILSGNHHTGASGTSFADFSANGTAR